MKSLPGCGFHSDLAGGEAGALGQRLEAACWEAPEALTSAFPSPPQCTQEDVSSEDEDEEMPEVGLPPGAALAGSFAGSGIEHPLLTALPSRLGRTQDRFTDLEEQPVS